MSRVASKKGLFEIPQERANFCKNCREPLNRCVLQESRLIYIAAVDNTRLVTIKLEKETP